MVAAIYPQGYIHIVVHDQRPNREAVRCNRRNNPVGRLRHENRSSHAHRVGCRASRGSHDQAVGLIGIQITISHGRMNRNHRRSVLFQHGHLVQGIRPKIFREAVELGLEQRSLLYFILPLHNLRKDRLGLLGPHIGQKAQPPDVHPQDRDSPGSYFLGGSQESPIATDTQRHIGLIIVPTVKRLDSPAHIGQLFRKKFIKIAVRRKLRSRARKHLQHMMNPLQAGTLIDMSEQ